MYWVSFALFTLFENYTYFVLGWVPFYAFFRLILLSYLVLPQTQGAKIIYQTHIHPFLAHHEARIDDLISKTHDQLKAAGLDYINQLIELIKRNVFGIQSSEPPRSYSGAESYATNLLARFNLPSARDGLAAPAGDFYGLLSTAIGTLGRTGTSNASRDSQIDELSSSGKLIPPHLTTAADKVRFVSQQREKLRVLLGALDKEAVELEIQKDVERRANQTSSAGLTKSKSEASFERIDKDEAADGASKVVKEAQGWIGWALGSGSSKDNKGGRRETDESEGRSSGFSPRN